MEHFSQRIWVGKDTTPHYKTKDLPLPVYMAWKRYGLYISSDQTTKISLSLIAQDELYSSQESKANTSIIILVY